jgi:SAM-dependent methyltransferase
MNLPFAESAEQNKDVIFDAIRPYLKGEVLEVGSGTGQHAVFCASQLPELYWQTSDLPNLAPPIELDVLGSWPNRAYDMVYTANSFHIMDATMVAACIDGVGRCLGPGGVFAVYGPFSYGGAYTSESNARFDQMLRARDPGSGIRDFEWIAQLANDAGLELLEDVAMPANNRTLIWQKRTL